MWSTQGNPESLSYENTLQQSALTRGLSICTEEKESSQVLKKSLGQWESQQHPILSVLTDVRTWEINKAKPQEPISSNIARNHYQEDAESLQKEFGERPGS